MIEERREIYFNYAKARLMIGVGILVIIGLIILPVFLKLIGFFIGGSLIYFAKKAVSSEVQLVFDQKELYIGYDSKKTYPRTKIKSLKLVSEKVDFRTLDFLRVTRYITVRGKKQTNSKDYPIQYLDISRDELNMLIAEFLDYE